MSERFTNRVEAGRQLAVSLAPFAGRKDLIILGLPPGGGVVAAEVARIMGAPLEAFVVCPIALTGGSPSVVGAVATGGVRVIDQTAVKALEVPRRVVDQESEVAQRELSREEHQYRLDRPLPSLLGRTAIVIDEGAVTGTTLISAIRALRLLGLQSVIAAAPMMSAPVACHIAATADRCVAVRIVPSGATVESSYVKLEPVSDDEIHALLQPHPKAG